MLFPLLLLPELLLLEVLLPELLFSELLLPVLLFTVLLLGLFVLGFSSVLFSSHLATNCKFSVTSNSKSYFEPDNCHSIKVYPSFTGSAGFSALLPFSITTFGIVVPPLESNSIVTFSFSGTISSHFAVNVISLSTTLLKSKLSPFNNHSIKI